jgi:hypothetical protein
VIWDLFSRIDKSSKTIVDLLDAKGISWSEYQEDMPYSGFQGDYVNQQNGANDYVRKHKYVVTCFKSEDKANRRPMQPLDQL